MALYGEKRFNYMKQSLDLSIGALETLKLVVSCPKSLPIRCSTGIWKTTRSLYAKDEIRTSQNLESLFCER